MPLYRDNRNPLVKRSTGYLIVGLICTSAFTLAAVVQIAFLLLSPEFRASGSPLIFPSLVVFVGICSFLIRQVGRELLQRRKTQQK
jgi:hypothetical protein